MSTAGHQLRSDTACVNPVRPNPTQLLVDDHRTASIQLILDMVICEKRQLAFFLGYLM